MSLLSILLVLFCIAVAVLSMIILTGAESVIVSIGVGICTVGMVLSAIANIRELKSAIKR